MAAAEEMVGASQSTDSFRLDGIISALPPGAADLKQILSNPGVMGLYGLMREASDSAKRSQQWKIYLTTATVIGAGVAALASGLLLYGQGSSGEQQAAEATLVGWAQRNLAWITLVQVIGLFAATVAGGVLAARDYGKLWTEQRRTAEGYRIQVFEAAYNLAATPPLLRQFLELFRRYQLDLQTTYYTVRGKQQQASDIRLIWFASSLAGLAAVTGILGSLNSVDAKFSVLAAFLGIAVPILLSAVQSWRTTFIAGAKASSYSVAGLALRNLRLKLAEIQTAADQGKPEVVKKFMDDAHAIMRAENGSFVAADH